MTEEWAEITVAAISCPMVYCDGAQRQEGSKGGSDLDVDAARCYHPWRIRETSTKNMKL